MANQNHMGILRQGTAAWNQWRAENPDTPVDLSDARICYDAIRGIDLREVDFRGANLCGATLRGADLSGANLSQAALIEADLSWAILREADLSRARLNKVSFVCASLSSANLSGADLREADLRSADLSDADLNASQLDSADISSANLSGAILQEADLSSANLSGANLQKADLSGAILNRCILVDVNLSGATLSRCAIYGVSVWNLDLKDAVQSDLLVTDILSDEPPITVDNLEVAQFVYLLLHNEKLRNIIDTLTTKSVLILGRFTPERKTVLDAIRDALRRRDYVPIVFDFEKSAARDLTETVMTLASLSRFVIADLSDPNSIPHELMAFARELPSVPIKPIFCPTKEHPKPYPMFPDHLGRFRHVMPVYRYKTLEKLLASFDEKIIKPAEKKAVKVRPKQFS